MTTDALLGPSQVRDLADRLGIRPTKSWGQNFVVDPGTVRRIVRVAEVTPGETVVEIGPGLGSLTLGLLEEALYNFHRYLFVMPILSLFEQRAHAMAEAGEALTADGMGAMLAGLLREGYGPALALDEARADGGPAAAEAVLTTDTHAKQTVQSRAGWTVGGVDKGAGMLDPALATMLAVLTTDAVVDAPLADAALTEAVRTTFNRLDSDGCMSTNDTVVLLASGASGVEPASADEFTEAVRAACSDLARQLVGDAEGAAHDVAVTVRGATSEAAAEAVARAVTSSNLVKAAIFGADPNWGRVLAAVGTVPQGVAPYDPDRLDVHMNGVQVARAGGVGDDRALVDLRPREVSVVVDLHAGEATATVWTNDLTHDYVHENSAYST